jgi:tRNA(adenine34) deaminase
MRSSARDQAMMGRCLACAAAAADAGDVPIGCVIADGDAVLAEAHNDVRARGELTGHAELNAIAAARRRHGRKLTGCTLYVTVEPCPMCAFCIREAEIARVVYALGSPVMGGVSRWNVLRDETMARALPEVFGPVPEVVAGFMATEAAAVWRAWSAPIWAVIKGRGVLVAPDGATARPGRPVRHRLARALARLTGWA